MSAADTTITPVATRTPSRAWRKFKRNRAALAGFIIIAFFAALALLAPLLPIADPLATSWTAIRLPPSAEHWMGTDEIGRDVFSRMVWGAQASLMAGIISVAIAVLTGVPLGLLAGYFGGWVDTVLMRITDIALAFPRLILALAFVAALGPGIENAIIAIALTSWPPYARLARAETLTIRNTDFIAASKLQGASSTRIIWGHVVPLCMPSVIVRVTLDMAGIILTAAGLGFLGLGAQPPSPEWGAMVASGRRFLIDQWWGATMPGIAIFVVSLGFNLLGDGLRDVLDPKGEK